MGLPSDIVSNRDCRFTPYCWQRTDESPRYQAIDVYRLPSTSRRPDRANQRSSRAVSTRRYLVSARRLGRTTSARRARHRRIRDNQDAPVLRELRLPTRDAARDCYRAVPGVTDPRTTPQREREAHGIPVILEGLPNRGSYVGTLGEASVFGF
jgi:hypothetical protein